MSDDIRTDRTLQISETFLSPTELQSVGTILDISNPPIATFSHTDGRFTTCELTTVSDPLFEDQHATVDPQNHKIIDNSEQFAPYTDHHASHELEASETEVPSREVDETIVCTPEIDLRVVEREREKKTIPVT